MSGVSGASGVGGLSGVGGVGGRSGGVRCGPRCRYVVRSYVASCVLDIGCRMLYKILKVGCWMLDVGCWMWEVGCWMLDVGCWMLDRRIVSAAMNRQTRASGHEYRPASNGPNLADGISEYRRAVEVGPRGLRVCLSARLEDLTRCTEHNVLSTAC